jgi:hypothetical protein
MERKLYYRFPISATLPTPPFPHIFGANETCTHMKPLLPPSHVHPAAAHIGKKEKNTTDKVHDTQIKKSFHTAIIYKFVSRFQQ